MGGHGINELVRQTANRRHVNFEGLRAEGYILSCVTLEVRPSQVVVGTLGISMY